MDLRWKKYFAIYTLTLYFLFWRSILGQAEKVVAKNYVTWREIRRWFTLDPDPCIWPRVKFHVCTRNDSDVTQFIKDNYKHLGDELHAYLNVISTGDDQYKAFKGQIEHLPFVKLLPSVNFCAKERSFQDIAKIYDYEDAFVIPQTPVRFTEHELWQIRRALKDDHLIYVGLSSDQIRFVSGRTVAMMLFQECILDLGLDCCMQKRHLKLQIRQSAPNPILSKNELTNNIRKFLISAICKE